MSNDVNDTEIYQATLTTITGIKISDVSIQEGNTGTKNAIFSVSLDGSNTQPITVKYTTANGTALVNSDYINTTGILTFTPGTTNKTIQVAIKGDTLLEGNENFYVNLSNATNADFTTNKGTITIKNDDDLANNVLFESNNSSIDISTALGTSYIEKVDRGITESIFGDLVVAGGLVS